MPFLPPLMEAAHRYDLKHSHVFWSSIRLLLYNFLSGKRRDCFYIMSNILDPNFCNAYSEIIPYFVVMLVWDIFGRVFWFEATKNVKGNLYYYHSFMLGNSFNGDCAHETWYVTD